MVSLPELISQVKSGNFRELSRILTLVENDLEGSSAFLKTLTSSGSKVIGITGPPGAGKSTLVNALIEHWTSAGSTVAVLAVDPTSPFNSGSLLGDRIRMSSQFTKPGVYIRSVATRGSLGGLSAKTIEMTDVLQAVGFDYILIETVGVGQSEVEIAGLADLSIVVLVPESGDEIQNIKSGLMEIADIFVVNKADREGATQFASNLKAAIQQKSPHIPILKTCASRNEGIEELVQAIAEHQNDNSNLRKPFLLSEKAWKLLQKKRMADINKQTLLADIQKASVDPGFNLYKFIESRY